VAVDDLERGCGVGDGRADVLVGQILGQVLIEDEGDLRLDLRLQQPA
jgi:hypothetical protein